MSTDDKQKELEELQARVAQLQAEIGDDAASAVEVLDSAWPPKQFYGAYYAMTGGIMGIFGAIASLLVNVIAAPIAGKSPMELIRVYLTFPVGAKALELDATSGGLDLVLGCCLYVATGMLIGIPIYLMLVKICGNDAPLGKRIGVACGLSLAVWVINFYLILSWLQPMLFGGNWITDTSIMPPWVAAGTHLVFGATLALLYPWGQFSAYVPTTKSAKT